MAAHEHSPSQHHISPLSTYISVFLILMVCTTVTVVVSRIHLGPLNLVVAIGIALTKAVIVILYFMHVKWSHRLIKIVVSGALLWLVILLILTWSDYVSRPWQSPPSTWELNKSISTAPAPSALSAPGAETGHGETKK